MKRLMMVASLPIFFFLLIFLTTTFAQPLCTDSWAPVTLKAPLAFCSYNGSSCCTSATDSSIQKQFKSMNISDPACASLVKSLLCTKCDPFSAQLFTVEPKLRTVPVLCNSTFSGNPVQSKDTTADFCAQVWDTCKEIPIQNSPFAPSLQGPAGASASSSKLTDLWQSENDFCNAFGGPTGGDTVCFNGKSVSFNGTQSPVTPKGICLERIGNGSYLSMAPHPDGSNRVFLANQAGKIWLATIPEEGSGGTLELDESSPFLDITDDVLLDTEFGMMGLAFHPNFTENGRFFVSFNCDKVQSPSCSGRCSCNSDAGCDPSKLGTSNGVQPCQYQSVIAEFTANSSSSSPSASTSARPTEVRRILTMGLPFTSDHGGQILFGPADGKLYFMMGDGSNKGDPFNFAQNNKSLLGKILRLDVDNIPSAKEIDDLGLWGNYSIPKDNPFAGDSELQGEIWALGLRNPWRCSFDHDRPSYFLCGDTGENGYEEIDLISKGGNYGWRIFEGPDVFHPTSTPGGNTSAASINPLFPVMGYPHSALNNSVGSASVTGGYVYRAAADPCLNGRYLFADLYAGAMWVGTENPVNSGNFSSTITPFSCSEKSPIACDAVEGSSLPSLGYIFSFGEDNNKDVYIMTSKGVYRVLRPSRCNISCPLESKTDDNNAPGASSSASQAENVQLKLRIVLVAFVLLLLGISSR
ncbi:HIPL1 protein-like [Iris pallida]|uniref:HIPL1 protein-like n=1 Tax=Iris pallida TaxID=29817 RepID=A0AAX6DND0_IRIPA|nr:HIPL1 protein-like [Iris pallida]